VRGWKKRKRGVIKSRREGRAFTLAMILQFHHCLQVEHDCSFYSDLGADFFLFMELIAKIEDEFGKQCQFCDVKHFTIFRPHRSNS